MRQGLKPSIEALAEICLRRKARSDAQKKEIIIKN
nr:MAG TPA: hypothetical protein [Microviridae sp.]